MWKSVKRNQKTITTTIYTKNVRPSYRRVMYFSKKEEKKEFYTILSANYVMCLLSLIGKNIITAIVWHIVIPTVCTPNKLFSSLCFWISKILDY